MSTRDLTFVDSDDPAVKRWLMGAIEDVLGRRRYVPLYREWRKEIAPDNPRMLTDLLSFLDIDLRLQSDHPWPPKLPEGEPLIMVANHPFGLGDGIVACALAEQLEKPYRVILNKDLMNISEIEPYALPIDFDETEEALKLNLETRAECRRVLKAGHTVVIFPAGGVATADNPFGRAEELPWKTFVARLAQQSKASILPIHFPGQNSAAFHLASRISMMTRLSLLISEFKSFPRRPFDVYVGPVIPFEDLPDRGDRRTLTDAIYRIVMRLNPEHAAKSDTELAQTPVHKRPNFPGVFSGSD